MKRIPALIPILPLNHSLNYHDDAFVASERDHQENTTKTMDQNYLYPQYSNQRHGLTPQMCDPYRPLPYIALPPFLSSKLSSKNNKDNNSNHNDDNDEKKEKTITIGRANIMFTISSACQCLRACKPKQPIENEKNRKKVKYRPTCANCLSMESWVCKFISKQMITIEYNDEYDDNRIDNVTEEERNSKNHYRWRVHCIGQNCKHIVRINDGNSPCFVKDKYDHNEQNSPIVKSIREGSTLTFIKPQQYSQSKDQKNKTNLDSSNSPCFEIKFQVSYIHTPTIHNNVEDTHLQNDIDAKCNVLHEKVIEKINENTLTSKSHFQKEENVTDEYKNKKRKLDSNELYAALDRNRNTISITEGESKFVGTAREITKCVSYNYRDNKQNQNENINSDDVIVIEKETKTNGKNEVIDLSSSPEPSSLLSEVKGEKIKTSLREEEQNSNPNSIIIYFLHRGRSMSKARIQSLTNIIEQKVNEEKKKNPKLNVQIQFNFCKEEPVPNLIVVDNSLNLEIVSFTLGFKEVKEMIVYFKKYNQCQFVKPDWIIHMKSVLEKPTIDQLWTGSFELKQKIESFCSSFASAKSLDENSLSCIKRNTRRDQFASISTVGTSDSDIEVISYLRRSNQKENEKKKNGTNQELSQLFAQLSRLYKEMPLDTYDKWRSYSYNLASARLKYLDFPILNDDESLSRLSRRKGFGNKFMRQIKEFLNTGQCRLVTEFEHDSMRVHVRNMTKIWGIGPMKAVELVKLGYTDIASVRQALEKNELHLYDNARLGVKFYEDFNEKMTRDEVERIGEIVVVAGKKYFKNAEFSIMGSYRRGIKKCGDIDILITHPKYTNCVPKGAIDELVERLRDGGHISHHLTKIDPRYSVTIPLRAEQYNDVLVETSKKAESYMGIFISPLYQNKHRRIDIKFYPYCERAFASLYFTGNGWFNRAIRLYAKTKKGLKLDDHGLFTLSTNDEKKVRCEGKRLTANSEKDIFDHLGLVYKEPHERDCFDAIVEEDGSNFNFQVDINNNDLDAEGNYKWIE